MVLENSAFVPVIESPAVSEVFKVLCGLFNQGGGFSAPPLSASEDNFFNISFLKSATNHTLSCVRF